MSPRTPARSPTPPSALPWMRSPTTIDRRTPITSNAVSGMDHHAAPGSLLRSFERHLRTQNSLPRTVGNYLESAGLAQEFLEGRDLRRPVRPCRRRRRAGALRRLRPDGLRGWRRDLLAGDRRRGDGAAPATALDEIQAGWPTRTPTRLTRLGVTATLGLLCCRRRGAHHGGGRNLRCRRRSWRCNSARPARTRSERRE